MAAIAALDGIVPDEVFRSFASTFGGVEHRIELVRVKDGVKYYNDSIASSPSRTIAGLRSFKQKVILIAGGYDKHIPYDVLGPDLVEHVSQLVLTGATADKIKAAAESAPGYTAEKLPICMVDDFADAVHKAAGLAKAGDIVILSPASASFDHFKNFMVRGNTFKQLVNEL
jgi:UDP-N-acetylmuramoylalanine--D-glutamate ligase